MTTEKSAPPGGRLPWAGKQVPQTHVEEELMILWHLALDNMRISQNMNVRTSVLNLVICTPDTDSAYRASTLLRELSNTHIARVTLVILDTRSDLPSSATTWVTLRSFPIVSDLMRHHFEQVTVHLSGNAVRSAAPIVQSLLKADLPAYLWWTSDLPADANLLNTLVAISSRAIVDSSTFAQPEEEIRTLSSLLQSAPACALSDFNWERVTPWRELIAQFFDVAEYRPYLVHVDTIEIEHSLPESGQDGTTSSANAVRALLLAAWLKTRLGWHLSQDDTHNAHDPSTGTYSWHMHQRTTTSALSGPLLASDDLGTPKGSIDIFIRPRYQTHSQSGTICLVRLTTALASKPAVFSIERGQDDEHVLTSVELPDTIRPQGTAHLASVSKDQQLLSTELEIMGRDQLYEETLHEVSDLLSQ